MTLTSDLAKIAADASTMHSIIHNASPSLVATDSGSIPSIATVLSNIGSGNARGAWVGGGTAYILNDVVTYSGSTYRCVNVHNSSASFATDLGAGRWMDQTGGILIIDNNWLGKQVINGTAPSSVSAGQVAIGGGAGLFSGWAGVHGPIIGTISASYLYLDQLNPSESRILGVGQNTITSGVISLVVCSSDTSIYSQIASFYNDKMLVRGTAPSSVSAGQVAIGGGDIRAAGSLYTGAARTVAVRSIVSAAGTTAIAATDHVCVLTGTTTHTFTLPAATNGRVLIFKNRSTGTLTINRAGSDTIDGGTTTSVVAGAFKTLIANGTDWCITG